MWRRLVTLSIVAVGIGTLALFFARPKLQKQELTLYFNQAMGLRQNAPVRMAGIDVGYVKWIQLRPERNPTPVEVIVVIQTTYDLAIPQDAIARVSTAGLLGEAFIDIDLTNAKGARTRNGGTLRTAASSDGEASKVFQRILENSNRKLDDIDKKLPMPESSRR